MKFLLGDKNARESVILGDKFLTDLSKLTLITNGNSFQEQHYKLPIGTPAPFVHN